MFDRNVLESATEHDWRRVHPTVLVASAALVFCVLLAVTISLVAVVISLKAYDSKAVDDAGKPVACPLPQPQELVDDFSGPAGARPDPQLWNYELGAGGTDGSIAAYTDHPSNASLDGNGNLAIVTINEPISYPEGEKFYYSSAALNTHGHLDFCYGKVAARIKLPTGKNLRPAFWLVGSDYETVGWPQCGEIDIIELPIGTSTLHGAGGYELPVYLPFDVSGEWHEYAVDWRRDNIAVSIDGHVFATWTPAFLPPRSTWTFNERPMYVILNMTVDGSSGLPDSSTRFPATMLVDWVRYTPAAPTE